MKCRKNSIGLIGGGRSFISVFESLKSYFDTIYLDTEIRIEPTSSCNIIYVSKLTEIKADCCLTVGYTKFISDTHGKLYLNLHPSLLPKYRGRHSIVWAILEGADYVGQTLHVLGNEVDCGDIISQIKIFVGNKSSQQIFDQIDRFNKNNIGRIVKEYLDGRIVTFQQSNLSATYRPKRSTEDMYIRPNQTVVYIERLFRALTPAYAYPMVNIDGNDYQVKDIERIDSAAVHSPDFIAKLDKNARLFVAKDGYVLLRVTVPV